MRILHTSDWHLGATLFGRRRHAEHKAFLDWLAGIIDSEGIETLLVCGDIFDTCTPGNATQELYYRFLRRATASGVCRHIVIIGGNHDSPSFLDAPSKLLECLNVHVMGSGAFTVARQNGGGGGQWQDDAANAGNLNDAPSWRIEGDPGDEVLTLKDRHGFPELVVCAVPHLRDRDVRTAGAGETPEDKERFLIEGIAAHYSMVGEAAVAVRDTAIRETGHASNHNPDIKAGHGIPVIVTGHLFTAGGRTIEGDGVRDLYVGNLGKVPVSVFPSRADYIALGHLHVSQTVAGRKTVRYSGSPLPMGFGEAGQTKSVCIVDFTGEGDTPGTPETNIRIIPVPRFQVLEQIRGPWDSIEARLAEIAESSADTVGGGPWIEIVYEGDEIAVELRERVVRAVDGTDIEVLRIRNDRVTRMAMKQDDDRETLEDLTPFQVFERCLNAQSIPDNQKPALQQAFQEILAAVLEGRDAAGQKDGH